MAFGATIKWPAFASGFAMLATFSACEAILGIEEKKPPPGGLDGSLDADATMGSDADANGAGDALPDSPNDGDASTSNPLLPCMDGSVYKACDGGGDGGLVNVCSDPSNCGECGSACDTADGYECGLGACIDYQAPGWTVGEPDYEVLAGDASVLDRHTNLVWERAIWVQSPSIFVDAFDHCANDLLPIEGTLGWHVPTRVEAISVVEEVRNRPAINHAMLPTVTGGPDDFMWIWTRGSDNTYERIHYAIGNTLLSTNPKAYLRCVTRKLPASESKASVWAGRKLAREGSEVRDAHNHLVWQAEVSTDGTNPLKLAQPAAAAHCSGLQKTVGGASWRLPTLHELESILDSRKKATQFVDPALFPNAPTGQFWSSTNYLDAANNHWTIDFSVPSTQGALNSSTNYVRCVAPEQ